MASDLSSSRPDRCSERRTSSDEGFNQARVCQIDHRRSSSTNSFPFLKLPTELRSMVISYLVVEDGPIPLHSRRLSSQPIRIGYHFIRCCGPCRGFYIETDDKCGCINTESYSTSCRCVSLFAPIFFVFKDVRTEALRLYWSEYTFCMHDKGPDSPTAIHPRRIQGLIAPTSTNKFQQVRRLVVDTFTCVGGYYHFNGTRWDESIKWTDALRVYETMLKFGLHVYFSMKPVCQATGRQRKEWRNYF